MFSRHDSGSSPVHGPYSKDFCQESFLFSEDTFQSAKGGQRRQEENVKETRNFYFPSIVFLGHFLIHFINAKDILDCELQFVQKM